ncbi:MAG: hypothetical protein GX786_04365, partial [Clostridiales bacterium]|nr:hypothetical protein [Clostridiales bacterium]
MKKAQRILTLILCFVLVVSAFMLPGCNKKPEDSKEDPTSEPQETKGNADDFITVALDTEPTHLALSLSADYITVWVAKNINDFLVEYDSDMELQLSMAKELKRIDDVTYEFEIYPDILFHNGREVKADDVKFSLDYILDPASGSSTASYFTSLESVEVTGDYTGVFHLIEPYFSFINKLTMVPIIPSENVDALKTAPVGCGPFKFKAWNKDQDIQIVKFDNYWKKDFPKCDGITFKIFNEYNTIHNSFLAGELDILMWSSFVDISTWDKTEGVHSQANELFDAFILVYNTEIEPFNDARVRRAIALALDKQEIIDLSSQGYGDVLDQPVYPGTYYYNEEASYTQNIDEAKALLAEAGYPDGFTCELLVPNTVQEGAVGDIMHAQLKAIGITCELEKMDVGVFIDAVWGKKNFEMCVTGDGSDGDPDTWLSRWFKSDAENNLGNYFNQELDNLIAEGASAATVEARKTAYDRAF